MIRAMLRLSAFFAAAVAAASATLERGSGIVEVEEVG